MSRRKGLVLDANILIRAVFLQRVLQILEQYEETARFFTPDVCVQDARKYIPDISGRRGLEASRKLKPSSLFAAHDSSRSVTIFFL
jgi:hypothetical protein